MKKISIIVPMYNSFSMMQRNLQVLEQQKAAQIELIVVDDCSSDDSFIAATEYAAKTSLDMVVLQNEHNGGPGVSRNNGIARATGDYVSFIDSDDYFSKNYTEILAPLMEQEIDCIIYDYVNVDENDNVLSKGKSISGGNVSKGFVDPKVAFTYTAGSTMCKIYRRATLEASGAKFGEYFRNEDMPFTKHAIAMSERVYYCGEHLYFYVQLSTSLMHNSQLTDERNCQRSYALLSERLAGQGLEPELCAIELREVLNTTVLIRLRKDAPRKDILSYIRTNYKKKHIKNPYFAGLPTYVRIISYCAYYRSYIALYWIEKYRRYQKEKSIKK